MKTILLLFFALITTPLFGQEKKNSFFNSIKFSINGISEIAGQWKPFEEEEDQYYNLPTELREEEDRPHTYFANGIDLQLNYMIDGAAMLGLGYQYERFTGTDMYAPMNTYYLHFRTGDDFDSKFSKYIELDLGGVLMDQYFEGIMYRITIGVDFQIDQLPITPTFNMYLGQRALSNISHDRNSGGFYNMIGFSAGLRIN